jgi:hypothetical protein
MNIFERARELTNSQPLELFVNRTLRGRILIPGINSEQSGITASYLFIIPGLFQPIPTPGKLLTHFLSVSSILAGVMAHLRTHRRGSLLHRLSSLLITTELAYFIRALCKVPY